MRKRTKLLLTVVVLMVATGATGIWKALATLPPSSGTPTPLSSYGTVSVATTFTASGASATVYLYIFSSGGPFYTEKINVEDFSTTLLGPVYLAFISYDSISLTDPVEYSCSVVLAAARTPFGFSFGDIISVAPYTMTDQTGAHAIPAANVVMFELIYKTCPSPVNFPEGATLTFEATVLAPTTATVSICASESGELTSCSK
jgi:hypothetical protein